MSKSSSITSIKWTSLGEECLIAGVGAACAGFFTNPLEVIKTRIQLQGELQARGQYTVHYRNVLHSFYAVARAESLYSLQKGLVPALWYQFTMNGLRFGIYQAFDNRGFFREKDSGSIIVWRSVVASVTSGAIGTFTSNPLYLVKTQLQSRSTESSKIAVGHQHPHASMTQGFRAIYGQYGLTGLWRGSTAAILRCAVGGSVQLGSFNLLKTAINKTGYLPADSWLNILVSAFAGGFLLASAMTPFDVLTTRLFNQPVDGRGRGLLYSGILDCSLKILKTEGLIGFYKGFTASFLRLGPHTVLSILFWQSFRKRYYEEKEKRRALMSLKASKTTALEEITLGGLGAMGACTVTNPLEVIKVRIQLQGELMARGEYTVYYRNVLQAFYAVASTESMRSLQKGLVPALCYQFLMNGCRFGAYQAFDNSGFFRSGNSGDVIFSKAILSSSISGGAGTWFGNPFYLIKCHLQSRSDAPIAVGHQHGYASLRDGFKEIYAEQGVRGFWTGGSAAILRGVVCGSVQMTSFTILQSYFVKSGIFASQSWYSTMTSTVISSCALCLVSNPVDVISTRLCNQEVNTDTHKGVTYKGITDCALKMYRSEGLYGFYKGFTASVIKNGPHTALALFFWQMLRKKYVDLFKSEKGGKGDEK